jgi:hypothetical protein
MNNFYLCESWIEVLVDNFPGLRVELNAIRYDGILSGALDQLDILGVAGERQAELFPVPVGAVAGGFDAHAEATHASKLVALVQEE